MKAKHIPGPWYSASKSKKAWLILRHVLPYQLARPYFYLQAWWDWNVTARSIEPMHYDDHSVKEISEGVEIEGGGVITSILVNPWTAARYKVGHGWSNAGQYYTLQYDSEYDMDTND